MKTMFRHTKTVLGAALIAVAITACKEKNLFDQNAYNEIISDAFPVTGVDPQHQWRTMRTITARISVDWYLSGDYRVDICTNDPMSASGVVVLGGGTVTNGGVLTTPLSCPMSTPATAYVALTDPQGHRTVKTARFAGSSLECRFDKDGSGPGSSSDGSEVTVFSRPDISAMTTGTTEIVSGGPTDGSAGKRLAVRGNVTAHVDALENVPDASLHVSGTWTLDGDQTVGAGATVVVTSGGRIVIPSGVTLSTAARTPDMQAGRIIVMPGATIEGGAMAAGADGCSGGTERPAIYNGGRIEVRTVTLDGGTLYDADASTLVVDDITSTAVGGRLVNHGRVEAVRAGMPPTTSSATRCLFALENACRVSVSQTLMLGGDSRIGRGASLESRTLTLMGTRGGGQTLRMGPDACLRSSGRMNIQHFGIVGPTAGGYAVVDMASVGSMTFDPSVRSEYIVNNVNLVYPQGTDTSSGLYNMYNGNATGTNLFWSAAETNVVTSASPVCTVEAGDCSTGFSSRADSPLDMTPYGIRYLFEDNFPQEGDYDFNDLVLTVAPRVDGREVTLSVTLDAIGTPKQLAAAIRVCGVSRAEVTAASMEGDFDFNNGKPMSSYMIIDSREMLLPDDKKLTGDLVINLFSDSHWAMSHVMEANGNIRRWLYNTVDKSSPDSRPDCADVPPVTVTYHLTLATPEAAARFVADNLDAFVIESTNGIFYEVHTYPYKLDQVIYQYIKDPANYADSYIWALQVPSPTRWPLEGVIIGSNRGGVFSGAYRMPGQSFCEWAISRSKAVNWWMYPSDGMVK